MTAQLNNASSDQHVSAAAPAAAGARDPTGGRGTGCACTATQVPSPGGEVIVLRVVGELDLSTVPVVQTALSSALAQRPDHLVVDLEALAFCSVRGLTVLVEVGAAALGYGTDYALAGASTQFNRLCALLWTETGRPIGFPTAADAVLAALAHQTGQLDQAALGTQPGFASRVCPNGDGVGRLTA